MQTELFDLLIRMLPPNLLVGIQQHRKVVADYHLIVEGFNTRQTLFHEFLGSFEKAASSVQIDFEEVLKKAFAVQPFVDTELVLAKLDRFTVLLDDPPKNIRKFGDLLHHGNLLGHKSDLVFRADLVGVVRT